MLQVGDKVKVIYINPTYNHSYNHCVPNMLNKIGVINFIDNSTRGFRVLIDGEATWCSEEELQKVNEMTKVDLKTGMLVYANNEWYLVLKDTACKKQCPFIMVKIDSYGWMPLDDSYINDDLIDNGSAFNNYTITKVAIFNYITQVFKVNDVAELEGFEIIWERETGKVTELNSLITKLEGQLTDAKYELNKIKRSE